MTVSIEIAETVSGHSGHEHELRESYSDMHFMFSGWLGSRRRGMGTGRQCHVQVCVKMNLVKDDGWMVS